MEILWFNIAWF